MPSSSPSFQRLNEGWNAEPNAPDVRVGVDGTLVTVRFAMNPFQFPEFTEDDEGVLEFDACWRWRYGPTNDEGWYRGACRFWGLAPAWGEFYEVTGDLLLTSPKARKDWQILDAASAASRHFLFYFRDGTFECDALAWRLRVVTPASSTTRSAHPAP